MHDTSSEVPWDIDASARRHCVAELGPSMYTSNRTPLERKSTWSWKLPFSKTPGTTRALQGDAFHLDVDYHNAAWPTQCPISLSHIGVMDVLFADEIIHHQRQEIEYMREQLHIQVTSSGSSHTAAYNDESACCTATQRPAWSVVQDEEMRALQRESDVAGQRTVDLRERLNFQCFKYELLVDMVRAHPVACRAILCHPVYRA